MPRRSALSRLLDVTVLIGLILLLLFPFAAELAASGAGVAPAAVGESLPPVAPREELKLVELPQFHKPDLVSAAALTDPSVMAEAVQAQAAEIFGAAGGEFWGLIVGDEVAPELHLGESRVYPYRFPQLDLFLERELPASMSEALAAKVNDLAATLVLMGAHFDPADLPGVSSAGGAAYALLDRVRAAQPSCLVQLNLAFVNAADDESEMATVEQEFDQARQACSGNPAVTWYLGQTQVERAYLRPQTSRHAMVPASQEVQELPGRTFRELQAEHPGSALGWAGEADAEVKLAEDARLSGTRGFAARAGYRKALALYGRAGELSDDPGIDVGRVRALSGLSRWDEAIKLATALAGRQPESAAYQALLVETLERAGRWEQAAQAARDQADRSLTRADGRALAISNDALEIAPWSIGYASQVPARLTVGYQKQEGAGADVYDFSYIPASRVDSLTLARAWCPKWTMLRDTLAAGHPDQVIAALDDLGTAEEPEVESLCPAHEPFAESVSPDELRLLAVVAYLAAGEDDAAKEWFGFMETAGRAELVPEQLEFGPNELLGGVFEAAQNLWRLAGWPDRARSTVDRWLAELPGDPVALDRQGELHFLAKRYAQAAQSFGSAARGYRSGKDREADWISTDLLKQGVSTALGGDPGSGRKQLKLAYDTAAPLSLRDVFDLQAGLVTYYARTELGNLELRGRDYPAADAAYAQAEERRDYVLSDSFNAYVAFGLVKGAEENNRALALILAHRGAEAERSALAAVKADPASPIYLQTLAYAHQEQGRKDRAAEVYAQAIAGDATLFPAYNDRGVLLAQLGRPAEALDSFRRAVGARPDYALGWFNLGVQLSELGAGHLLEAQGALARAARLDSDFRDRDRELAFDTDPYLSGLDVSRPLPERWSFAESQSRAPLGLTVLIVLILLGRLLWNVGLDQVAGKLNERFLGWASSRLNQPFAPAIAVVVTAGLALWPLLTSTGWEWAELLLLLAGVLAMVGVYVRSRLALAGPGEVRHYTWLPAVGVGAVLTAVGLGFAPVPSAQVDSPRRSLRWVGLAALGAVCVALLVLGWVTRVPATRAVGASALVMVGSVLVPVKPFDGAYLKQRLVNLALTLGLLLISVLLLLNVL